MQLDTELLEVIYTNKGEDLKTLSEQQAIMLIFLRHFGCTFCRESLSDLAKCKEDIQAKGVKPILVHMASEEIGDQFIDKYQLDGIDHISDPDLSLYEYFGLFKGNFAQLYGLKVWLRGFKAVVVGGHGSPYAKKDLGNPKQMPGLFIIKNNNIIVQFVHRTAADKTEYTELLDDFISSNPQIQL